MKGVIIERMLDNGLDLSQSYTIRELADLTGLDATQITYKARQLNVEGTFTSTREDTYMGPRRSYKLNPDNKFFKCILTKRSNAGFDDSSVLNTIR